MSYIILTEADILQINNTAVICSDEHNRLLLYEPIPDHLGPYFEGRERHNGDEPIVPRSISKLQALLYLHQIGRLDELNLIIKEIDGIHEIAYNAAHQFDRDSQMIAYIAGELMHMTEQDLDELFINASNIKT
jgi:hypothetical protein